jgi:hypothetical protein
VKEEELVKLNDLIDVAVSVWKIAGWASSLRGSLCAADGRRRGDIVRVGSRCKRDGGVMAALNNLILGFINECQWEARVLVARSSGVELCSCQIP